MTVTETFPAKFREFLTANNISTLAYADSEMLPRYVRVNPRGREVDDDGVSDAEWLASELELDLGQLRRVEWLPTCFGGVFAVDAAAHVTLATKSAFTAALIHGIDAASCAAVAALGPVAADDHVLDLCCAPGAKLCLLADLIEQNANIRTQNPQTRNAANPHKATSPTSIHLSGSVTGVDLSPHRIATCKSLLRKYKVSRFRLFALDGTTFNVHAPSRIGAWSRASGLQHLDNAPISTEKLAVSADQTVETEVKTEDFSIVTAATISTTLIKPFHVTKLLRNDPQIVSPRLLYDKVLVDAECTHDGSISHLIKCNREGWQKFEEYFSDPKKMDALEILQRNLLSNGFRLLKPGGVLVYSTCSFLRRQNEDIIEWFIKNNTPNAILEDIPNASEFPVAKPLSHSTAKMLRFTPTASKTSGLEYAGNEKEEV
ncbi:hypothetical protein HK100_009596 [Physocladia obscura]|uniref:SAM-dependent MTase RsmB/NOP-type domain-containing protein n=1 Tax=Physocladia obscura TaxID=109957 RepID=A0AAD5T347_9FUNG|nr:hypothetical protein HK100_009596 [Physocladia obscura]